MSQSLALSVVGLVLSAAGVYLNWGAGWACLACGLVFFVVGGLLARREGL